MKILLCKHITTAIAQHHWWDIWLRVGLQKFRIYQELPAVNMEADKSSLLLLLAFYQCMLGAAGYNVPALCYINLKHERSGIKEIRSSSQIQL